MDSGNWRDVSIQAKDLVTQMLCVEPASRISMEGIINHPWIVKRDQLPQNMLAVRDTTIKGRMGIYVLSDQLLCLLIQTPVGCGNSVVLIGILIEWSYLRVHWNLPKPTLIRKQKICQFIELSD